MYAFQDDKKDKSRKDKDNIHLKEFLTTVQSLGVSFSVYRKDNKWEWTSLLGGEKRALLRKLPELFHKFLPENKIEATKNLWIVSIKTLNKILVGKTFTLMFIIILR